MSAWTPALRIARRSVMRNRARSLLVVSLVALPVAGATFADVLARTFESPERQVRAQVGSADAQISVTPYKRLRSQVSPGAGGLEPVGKADRDPSQLDVRALVPAGSRVVASPSFADIRLEGVRRSSALQLVLADVREPLHRHQARLDRGHAPAGPGEVLVSHELAQRLKLLDDRGEVRADAQVQMRRGPRARVSGLSLAPQCLSCEQVVAAPGSAFAKAAAGPRYTFAGPPGGDYLVDLPPGASRAALSRKLRDNGAVLTTREELLRPVHSDDPTTADDLRAIALVAVIIGLGLLEIVLLAGTAFAVGARRQVRELGLVTASGGSPRDVRRMVLAQGLVLGAIGAATGLVAGAALALGGRPLWERLSDREITTWAAGPWEIAAIAIVGLLSGVAAALVPAITAGRMRPVDALAGRFADLHARSGRKVWLGAALAVAGAACGLAGDRMLADDFAAYERLLARVARTGEYVSAPAANLPLSLVVGGATLLVAGLVLLTPALLGWLASAAARLPLSLRLAVRDAGRHRHRTGPATTAITMAVAGSIVLAFLVANRFRADEARRVPLLPANVLTVAGDDAFAEELERAAVQAADRLPDARRISLRTLRPHPSPDPNAHAHEYEAAVADSEQLARLVGGSGFDARARRALREGRALVVDPSLLDGAGRLPFAGGSVAAHVMRTETVYRSLPTVLLAPSFAQARRLALQTNTMLVAYRATATDDEIDAAIDAADRAGAIAFVDGGLDDEHDVLLLIIAGVAALLTIFGVAISVALSAAEGRADLATLAAVGAPPRRRREIVASQALLIGGLGCVIGVGFGTFVAFTARAATGSPEFVVPWMNLLVTGIAVPLLAAAVAALCARGRLQLVRRAE